MESLHGQVRSHDSAFELANIQRKGVKLWLEEGQLRYRAPKGALDAEEMERLRLRKNEIVSLLRSADEYRQSDACVARGAQRAPLTYSQIVRINSLRSSKQPFRRTVASVTLLCGRLDVEAMQRAVAATVHRHEALRTRIVACNADLVQEVTETRICELRVDDLTTLKATDAAIDHLIVSHMVTPIDPSKDPLCDIRLLKITDTRHVLLVAMEHIISDASSLNIVLRDLAVSYRLALQEDVDPLPSIRMQFPEYALLQSSGRESWIEKHGGYWEEQLACARRLRFPVDQDLGAAGKTGWGTVPVHIGSPLKASLQMWCKQERTTMAMAAFTAFAALVLRWCNSHDTVFPYQTDGRVCTKVGNTVGYFAAVLYLRISLMDGNSFRDLLRQVTEAYCKAHEHADFGYIDAQMPEAEFGLNAGFNWVPQSSGLNLPDLRGSADPITCYPMSCPNPGLADLELDGEPCIVLFDAGDVVTGTVSFPLNRFSTTTMERFVRSFVVLLTEMVRQPEQRVGDVTLI